MKPSVRYVLPFAMTVGGNDPAYIVDVTTADGNFTSYVVRAGTSHTITVPDTDNGEAVGIAVRPLKKAPWWKRLFAEPEPVKYGFTAPGC